MLPTDLPNSFVFNETILLKINQLKKLLFMKRFLLFLLCSCVGAFSSYVYSQQNMKLSILKTKNISGFPSGSGIAYVGGKYYAIGDDSPFLYVIDENFKIIEQISLLEVKADDFKGNRIKKKRKTDFETLEAISSSELVTFGSGSKSPQRDIFVQIHLGASPKITSFNLTSFYEEIKKLPLLTHSELNIEATAYLNGQLYLFNRANNVIIRFNYQQFLKFLSGGVFPTLEAVKVTLPIIEGYEAGFSGAAKWNDSQLIFTASVEETDDAYNDGEIIGSLVGVLNIADFSAVKVERYSIIPNSNQKTLKVESVTLPATSAMRCDDSVIFITDDDNGNTELIKARLRF